VPSLRLVVVVGQDGVGKSNVVRALLPYVPNAAVLDGESPDRTGGSEESLPVIGQTGPAATSRIAHDHHAKRMVHRIPPSMNIAAIPNEALGIRVGKRIRWPHVVKQGRCGDGGGNRGINLMDEAQVQSFWNAHPCGDAIVGGLHRGYEDDYEKFFQAYDTWRYQQEAHIPACLDRTDWRGRQVLEIGLGEGAESEQLIRRGAIWSGLDLTQESVDRVEARLQLRGRPYAELQQGSALNIPWPDDSFDLVFSHGVLHHIPDIQRAQREIHRVLRPGGTLVAMLYARHSLNYQVSIRWLRRAALLAAYPARKTTRVQSSAMLNEHLRNAEEVGLRNYLRMDAFTHRNTDGPLNPFARVYSLRDVVRDFPDFRITDAYQRYMHAPPLPVSGLPGEGRLGWHLWVTLEAR